MVWDHQIDKFQSELSRKQVKKHPPRRRRPRACRVSIRVIPEAGQEEHPGQSRPPRQCSFNPSYPGSRSRRVVGSRLLRASMPGFNPSYPGSRSRSVGPAPELPEQFWFQSELSRKQVKKSAAVTATTPPTRCFNPSYPGSRSRRQRRGTERSPLCPVSIRVIPEAGQEGWTWFSP